VSVTDTKTSPRRPWIAFILSLLMPGLGQFYCGRWLGAVSFYAPLLVLAFLHRWAVSLEWPTSTNLAIVCAAVALCLAAAMEAAVMAHRAAFQPITFNRWYFYLPAILWNAILIPGIAALWSYHVPSQGMGPTIIHDDYILTASYGFPAGSPSRCDVAVFIHDQGGGRVAFIKRVVALEGDRVAYRDGRLVINGTIVYREKIAETADGIVYRETLPGGCSHLMQEENDTGPLDNMDTFVVPSDTAFVLGDNRDDSMDSRVTGFGPVPLAKFRGKVFMIYAAKDSARIGALAH
jgi:signal peptidase I